MNDGGIVAALFLMAAAIAFAIFNAVALYESSSRTKMGTNNKARLLRLLSGWANLGNSFIHILLTVYTLSNANNESEYWVKERKLGGIGGPIFLVGLNTLAGMSALKGYGMYFPIGWNSFVAVVGTFLPIVWPRFLEEGITSWPYIIVFIWFSIFFFELTAVTCSVAHFALVGGSRAKSE
jgi:hypothetical protein